MKVAYDFETYPNVFTASFIDINTSREMAYEISLRRNDLVPLREYVSFLIKNNATLVGFNNAGFDYPILHLIMSKSNVTVADIYLKAQTIITDGWFEHHIWDDQRLLKQCDLYKIHHFDNKAKATSLKVLEFNMQSNDIRELPYKPGTMLTGEQIDNLISYNMHDVRETIKFYHKSKAQIDFRQKLFEQYKDLKLLNYNDGKIGEFVFINRLGRDYFYDQYGGKKQTPREYIDLDQVIFPYIRFESTELDRILYWFKKQRVVDTKGAFKSEPSATVNGFTFVFGTGGIHGSVEKQIIKSDEHGQIIDVDVASYYPNLGIQNRLYPEHLSEEFIEVYLALFDERSKHKKGTPENAMLKLALNTAYGNSNNKHSVFYDPKYTMAITINGQLLLCMLAEQLMKIPGLQFIQANTDGVTFKCPHEHIEHSREVCRWWERLTSLTLEEAQYTTMWIKNVNSYMAQYTDGKIKRIKEYEYNLDWHKDFSALVVPKAAEKVLVDGWSPERAVMSHSDFHDFMLRTKIPRSSRLELGGKVIQNVTRYYIATNGEDLIKVMPPLAKAPDVERRIGIRAGWLVRECNDIRNFNPSVLDYRWYIQEVEKLIDLSSP